MNAYSQVDLGSVAHALAMSHPHTPLERRQLRVEEQSPPHGSFLLELIAVQLHFHLEICSTKSIHGVMNVLEPRNDRRFKKIKKSAEHNVVYVSVI